MQSRGQRQDGVLFEIKTCERENLDLAEGVGFGYDRDDSFSVILVDTGVSKTVITYIAPVQHPCLKPFDWYLALVVAGAKQHNLPEKIITSYRDTEFREDEKEERKLEARKVLKEAGWGSVEQVLELN